MQNIMHFSLIVADRNTVRTSRPSCVLLLRLDIFQAFEDSEQISRVNGNPDKGFPTDEFEHEKEDEKNDRLLNAILSV